MNNQIVKKPKYAVRHCGFTLVELLLVIAIIAVMSSMALGVMRKAQDSAKEAATLSRISQIEAIISVVMEDFEVRRLPISNRELAGYAFANPNHAGGTNLVTQVRQLRRQILMDIINAELPRPIVNPAAPGGFELNPNFLNPWGSFPTNQPSFVASDPMNTDGRVGFFDWLDEGSLRPGAPPRLPPWGPNYDNPFGGIRLSLRLSQLTPSRVLSYRRNVGQDRDGDGWDDFNLPGEYLYAILERIDVDGTPAVELLGNAAVGNSDDDGFKEVVDAWGEPMQLRIWQVRGREIDNKDGNLPPGTDVWEDWDMEPNFDNPDTDPASVFFGEPHEGYSVLDPTTPRDLSKIRVEVISTRLQY